GFGLMRSTFPNAEGIGIDTTTHFAVIARHGTKIPGMEVIYTTGIPNWLIDHRDPAAIEDVTVAKIRATAYGIVRDEGLSAPYPIIKPLPGIEPGSRNLCSCAAGVGKRAIGPESAQVRGLTFEVPGEPILHNIIPIKTAFGGISAIAIQSQTLG